MECKIGLVFRGFWPFPPVCWRRIHANKAFLLSPSTCAPPFNFRRRCRVGECLEWLRQLKHEKLESGEKHHLLDEVINFINKSELLPQGATINEVTATGVRFVDGNGFNVSVRELSDGFRSMLSLIFELIRQMELTYGRRGLFDNKNPARIVAPGVVLIDEIDAHLHPTWQRKIGLWFREHFPHVQFFVTTHSPLICQAADCGTVFKLATPGTAEEGGMVTGDELNRLLYGSVADAYGTDVFGRDVARSPQSLHMLHRLAVLNQKEIHSGLTEGEKAEQTKLRGMLRRHRTS